MAWGLTHGQAVVRSRRRVLRRRHDRRCLRQKLSLLRLENIATIEESDVALELCDFGLGFAA